MGLSFLANDNGKPARSVVFMAIAAWLVALIPADVMARVPELPIEGGKEAVAFGIAMYLLERGYRKLRQVPAFGAWDPWSGEA